MTCGWAMLLLAWQDGPEIEIDRDNLVIEKSVRIKPGVYKVVDEDKNGVLQIAADDITIDFQGATLDGSRGASDQFDGIGIALKGRKGVTIKNARVHGFLYNIRVEGGSRVALESCDVSRSRGQVCFRDGKKIEIWLVLRDVKAWRSYGAGIWIEGSKECVVKRCVGRGAQNGVLLVESDRCRVLQSDFSFNSGWGIGLWKSCENRVMYNRADFVNRPWGGFWGGDSAALVVVNDSHRNWIVGNSLTHGGDGLFLTNHADAGDIADGPCNENLIAFNDGSYSTANAFEATFSERNQFLGNIANHSSYGYWCGYSSRCLFVGNTIADNRNAGVAIEHGEGNWIEGNEFARNGAAIEIWHDPQRKKSPSRQYAIRNNRVLANRVGVSVRETEDVEIENNEFSGNEWAMHVGARVTASASGNHFEKGKVLRVTAGEPVVDLRRNSWDADPAIEAGKGKVMTGDPLKERAGPLVAYKDTPLPKGWEWLKPGPAGTVDWTASPVYPDRLLMWGAERMFVSGPAKPFSVEGVPASIEVTPARGEGPAVLTLKPSGSAPQDGTGRMESFEFKVRQGDQEHPVRGVLVRARWKIRYFVWKDLKPEDADGWKKLFESKPAREDVVDGIDFTWGTGRPAENVPADHFADRAECEIEFPEGEYEFHTVSDDGVRVRVDDKIVIENWTWHAPTANQGTLRLSAGKHRIVVEHFEITGVAQLQLGWSAK